MGIQELPGCGKGEAIALTDLKYERGGREILRGISLKVEPGSVTAVVGPNGAGKSTLLKVISGFLRPKSGTVLVGGHDPAELSPNDRSRLVTYCGDEPDPVFAFTAEETVEMSRVTEWAADPYTGGRRGAPPDVESRESLRAAMEALDVLDLRDRTITSLSSGERQRVYLARAVYQDPAVYLLDEPTTHLDMFYEIRVMDMIGDLAARRGKTILTVVHDLNLALRSASRLFFVKDGTVAYSVTPEEVSGEIVRDVYGVEAIVKRDPATGVRFVIPAARTPGPIR